ncbi:MAG: tetratricopeptide repeat protein [Polaromonas sp.]|nr:tetratricopeptide repeat protein [Polaromonas sp.]
MKKLRSIHGGVFRLTTFAKLTGGLWTATLTLTTALVAPTAWAQTPAPVPAARTTTPTPSNEPPATLQEAKAAEVAAQPSDLDSALFYQLLVGEITAQDGDAAAGFALMLDAARKTNNPELYQRATDIALQSRSGDAALVAAKAWKLAQPTSREANRYVLQILIALNRIAETLEPLTSELAKAPNIERPLAIGAIPRAYARASDKSLAASTVEQALATYLNNPATASAAWTTTGRMRLAAGDTAGALVAAQRGQAVDVQGGPHAEGPALVALELMDPKLPAAEVLVKNYLDGNAQALPGIRMAYARALLDAQRYAEATAQVQKVTRDSPEFPDSWLVLGALQLQDNQLLPAQTSLERYIALVEQSPNVDERQRGLDQAYLSLSQVAEKRKDFPAAEAWLAKIDNSAELVQTQSRRASILASQGKLAEARLLISQLPERTPEEARAKVSAEASLLREAKQYRQAYDVLASAIAKTPNDAELIYDQAMMAEKLNALPEMEKLLQRVISLKPDYHHAYNALGYSLAERNLRLPEAKALIEKAVSFAPADPFIQDSLGWVEFRLGNAPQAVRIFESAFKAKPDAEIAAHYGEVLWSLGQRERAIAIFKEGLLLAPDNESLRDTIKRLRVAL